MKASVIIPSYNACERLKYNLIALNNQSYKGDDVEVIVIDNGSQDNTADMLKAFELKYPLKVIRITENRGIAYGRNQGILKSKGDILIFHDSDMIASRDFIKQHLDAHAEPGVVACGLFWRRIFTYYYNGFNSIQISNFEAIKDQMDLEYNFYNDGFPLINEAEVANKDLYDYSFDLDFGFIKDLKNIIIEYGRDLMGYYLPWRFFITNNLSVEREKVIAVGMFDDKIVRYGYEDYDLGIRLYKSGCRFKLADYIISLHQEHSPNCKQGDLEANIKYMCEKYNNIYFIDMLLVCLSDNLMLDKTKMNDIMKDIYAMLPLNEYHILLELFIELLQIVQRRIFSPWQDQNKFGFQKVAEKLQLSKQKINELYRKGRAMCFLDELFDLLGKTLNINPDMLFRENL